MYWCVCEVGKYITSSIIAIHRKMHCYCYYALHNKDGYYIRIQLTWIISLHWKVMIITLYKSLNNSYNIQACSKRAYKTENFDIIYQYTFKRVSLLHRWFVVCHLSPSILLHSRFYYRNIAVSIWLLFSSFTF